MSSPTQAQIESPPSARGFSDWIRSHHVTVSVVTHVLLFAGAWLFSFLLAYNFDIGHESNWLWEFFLPLLLPVVLIKTMAFAIYGLHRDWWRYVSFRDVRNIAWASWWSFVGLFVLYYGLQNAGVIGLRNPFEGDFPDSVFLIDFGLTVATVSAARLAVRLYHEDTSPVSEGPAAKLLIIGAGNAGETAVREMLRMPIQRYRIIGFLDDDRLKHGALIHGIEVLGPIAKIKDFCEEYGIDEILIAMPSASKEQIRRVFELCEGANVRFKTLPALSDVLEGRASATQIRDVDINDLLGRAPVKLDEEGIAAFIRDRVVMVTGAGGSIGAEMCRQIARFAPRRLLLLEQAEQGLFYVDKELKENHPGLCFVPYIADIGDKTRLERLFAAEKPSVVFHAAAHKHVPMMELNPGEAIKNNIHGTRTVADVARASGVEKFVMISTDKAVNPTSIMGCSKRVAEMYIQALNQGSSTQFVTVRFGNVLGSSGSVVPIFREQIARGGPVTVTDPRMVRYFMTIPEASQLVLQSASMGSGGEIFVLDMGEPVRIVDLAREMIRLSGFRPDVDIKIEYSGIRTGEKLYEELSMAGEDISSTTHPKIGIWRFMPVDSSVLNAQIDQLVKDSDSLDRDVARRRLKEIVPEFQLEAPPARPVEDERSGKSAA